MSTKGMARSGAEGNTRLLKDYGGGSTPPRQSYPKGYATGGHVKAEERAIGGPAETAEGMPARPSLARPGRKMGKGKMGKKGGTNVNVVIMPKGDGPGAPAPAAMDKPMPPPAMMPPPPPPPMPPPGAGPGPGGPPMGMPMRKAGGKVGMFKRGGHVKHDDEAQDKAMIKGMVKPSALKRSEGGPVLKGMDAGAGGAKGRLEKIEMVKRGK